MKIFYRANLENGHPEVPEVHDRLEVPYKVFREWVIRAKNFPLVPHELLYYCYLKILKKNQSFIISDGFQLILNKNQAMNKESLIFWFNLLYIPVSGLKRLSALKYP